MSGLDVQRITEIRVAQDPPLWEHPEWRKRFPWLVQGITSPGEESRPFDLGLFGSNPTGAALERWRRLRASLGMPVAVHARQVHGSRLLVHSPASQAGLHLFDDADGHATREAGVLLTVSVADCVPVTLVSDHPRTVAVLHAGWRGVVAGILERGLELLEARLGCRRGELWLHCGPAICGRCYEVGPEVQSAVRPAWTGASAAGLDLRAALAERALSQGIPSARISVSAICVRCDADAWFSHRGGSNGRQMAFAGIRPEGGDPPSSPT